MQLRISHILFSLIIFSLLIKTALFANFSLIKEENLNIYYSKTINPYTTEYIIKLAKTFNGNFKLTFNITNNNPINLYLYDNTVQFINEQSTMWWQNYLIKSNNIYLNNLDLLLEKNSLQNILKYLIFYVNLNYIYSDHISPWLINGIAIYYSDKGLFKKNGVILVDFNQITEKLNKFTFQEEFEQVNYYCFKAVSYMIENYNEKTFYNYINQLKNPGDYSNNFFNFFGISFPEFTQEILK